MAQLRARQIAERIGASRPFISRILNGTRSPSADMAVKLEEATGIDRRAWMWPEDYQNPLIKTTKSSEQPNQVKS
jgi:plasmid maintenance system antidote protein VapI